MTEASQSQSHPTMSYAGDITNEDKSRFQSDIARGFYAAGLPFRTIEVPRMRKALTSLQPEMERYLPTPKALTERLLTKEHEREKATFIARLRDEPTVALVSDGWSSVSKEIINYIVISPLMRPLLWCTKMTGDDEQTSEYVAKEIRSVINEIHSAVAAMQAARMPRRTLVTGWDVRASVKTATTSKAQPRMMIAGIAAAPARMVSTTSTLFRMMAVRGDFHAHVKFIDNLFLVHLNLRKSACIDGINAFREVH
ncbi:unnamed protein product [Phytophthora fragariaefolia]|uniref:Unnamed protein product n=1 Tax=Phytophthora fragariaefolia TaxID=1490495 RepID=A0A9W7CTM5_9STRA|nr:unnamed protein product [Phytophthora fragariaefolia]